MQIQQQWKLITNLKVLRTKKCTNIEHITVLFKVFHDSLKGYDSYKKQCREDKRDNADGKDESIADPTAIAAADEEECCDYIFENYEKRIKQDMVDGDKLNIPMMALRFFMYVVKKIISS